MQSSINPPSNNDDLSALLHQVINITVNTTTVPNMRARDQLAKIIGLAKSIARERKLLSISGLENDVVTPLKIIVNEREWRMPLDEALYNSVKFISDLSGLGSRADCT